MKILLIEKNGYTRKLLKDAIIASRILPNESFLAEAIDGSRGLQLFKSFKPNIVVMEAELPDMKGLDLCLQFTGINPNCRIIVVSQSNIEDIADESIRYGATKFFSKPFQVHSIVSYISGQQIAPDDTLPPIEDEEFFIDVIEDEFELSFDDTEPCNVIDIEFDGFEDISVNNTESIIASTDVEEQTDIPQDDPTLNDEFSFNDISSSDDPCTTISSATPTFENALDEDMYIENNTDKKDSSIINELSHEDVLNPKEIFVEDVPAETANTDLSNTLSDVPEKNNLDPTSDSGTVDLLNSNYEYSIEHELTNSIETEVHTPPSKDQQHNQETNSIIPSVAIDPFDLAGLADFSESSPSPINDLTNSTKEFSVKAKHSDNYLEVKHIDTFVTPAIQELDLDASEDTSEELDLGEAEDFSEELDLGELEDTSEELDLGEAEDTSEELDLGELEDSSEELDLGELEDFSEELDLGEAEDFSEELDLGEAEDFSEELAAEKIATPPLSESESLLSKHSVQNRKRTVLKRVPLSQDVVSELGKTEHQTVYEKDQRPFSIKPPRANLIVRETVQIEEDPILNKADIEPVSVPEHPKGILSTIKCIFNSILK